MSGGSAFDAPGRYDESAAIAHDQERLSINKAEHPDNVIEGLFRAHGQFNGLTPLDESVANDQEHQREIGRLAGQVERLREALARKDEAMALLRDALAESEAELDAVRAMLAEKVS